MLVTVGVAVGFCTVDDDKLGPLHAQPVVELFEFEERFTVPPTHIGPLFVAPVDDGIGFTVTIVV